MTKQQSLTMGKTQRMVGLAIFTAIIIVLQLVSTFIKFGPFSITLAMIPIVVGAAVYGAGAGAYLGGVFSVVVLICCVTGADPGGAVVWNANPFLCIVVCMAKGIAAVTSRPDWFTASSLPKACWEAPSQRLF